MESHTPTSPLSEAHQDLMERFRAGQRAALARVISIVENQRPGFQALLHEIHPETHGAIRVGITGPPGAGKSTLTAELIERYRAAGLTVGVIAVDPTSPYTGGALLGDRIRMNEVAQDRGVFIRSMATRGALGGLAAATREVMDVLAAYGFDVIIVETVGVGQSELDIAAAADTTAVVLVPESGDSIQTMKAGLMEAADLFVVNKADRPGAPRLAKEVEMMLHLRLGKAMRNIPAHHGVQLRRADTARSKMRTRTRLEGEDGSEEGERSAPEDADGRPEGWTIPVLLTTAETGEGLDALMDGLREHAEWLRSSGELERRRRARLEERVRDAVQQRLLVRAWQEGRGGEILEDSMDALVSGELTPYEVAARIVHDIEG
ncbi:MAG: methylmalonyl Co-A mutase-associated GTPase MeaB [Longimicrobiales bacterium]|nr:methylmalonyl Co-A mutase-associated GTPase MeaB [Longimicrobiales bacterium]